MARRQIDREGLASELASLTLFGLEELRARWESVYSQKAPAGFRTALLIQGIGFKIQERAFGGLKPSTRRLLDQVGAGSTMDPGPKAPRSGTVLIREWRGRSHEAHVLERGVRFDGQHYESLSAVAREITGARWSGPAFFGLKSRAARS